MTIDQLVWVPKLNHILIKKDMSWQIACKQRKYKELLAKMLNVNHKPLNQYPQPLSKD